MDRGLCLGFATLALVTLGSRTPSVGPAKTLTMLAPEGGGPSPLAEGPCPPGLAPDGDACVHLTATSEGPMAEARTNAHRERSGRWATYEQIARLPERPADYDAYRYPIPPGIAGGHYVASGYDLDQPDDKQRRASGLRHVGHGAVDLPQVKGTPVQMVALEHQEGDAEVLYAGPLFGTTLLTRHTLREGGQLRDYVMLLGHLDSIAPGVTPGTRVSEGTAVATVGDSGSPRFVHLHLEFRRVREGIDLGKVAAGAPMIAEHVSVVCDPRNVLPLR